MNPLLISGYNVSIPVERDSLKVSTTDNHTENLTFRPPQIPHDSIIIEGHYCNILFEAIRWLMKNDFLVSVLAFNNIA